MTCILAYSLVVAFFFNFIYYVTRFYFMCVCLYKLNEAWHIIILFLVYTILLFYSICIIIKSISILMYLHLAFYCSYSCLQLWSLQECFLVGLKTHFNISFSGVMLLTNFLNFYLSENAYFCSTILKNTYVYTHTHTVLVKPGEM